jgi:hypothetical protein
VCHQRAFLRASSVEFVVRELVCLVMNCAHVFGLTLGILGTVYSSDDNSISKRRWENDMPTLLRLNWKRLGPGESKLRPRLAADLLLTAIVLVRGT